MTANVHSRLILLKREVAFCQNTSELFSFPVPLPMFNETSTSHHLKHMSEENSLFYDCALFRGPIYRCIPRISRENIFPFYFPAKSSLHFLRYSAEKGSSLPRGAVMQPSVCRKKKKKFKCDYFDKNTLSACFSLSLVGYSSTLSPSTVHPYICSIYNIHNSCCTGITAIQTINMLYLAPAAGCPSHNATLPSSGMLFSLQFLFEN